MLEVKIHRIELSSHLSATTRNNSRDVRKSSPKILKGCSATPAVEPRIGEIIIFIWSQPKGMGGYLRVRPTLLCQSAFSW